MSEPASNSTGANEPDAPPPVLGTWRRFYGVVVANTILIYLLLILFSVYAR